jgi:hypothetical protein
MCIRTVFVKWLMTRTILDRTFFIIIIIQSGRGEHGQINYVGDLGIRFDYNCKALQLYGLKEIIKTRILLIISCLIITKVRINNIHQS